MCVCVCTIFDNNKQKCRSWLEDNSNENNWKIQQMKKRRRRFVNRGRERVKKRRCTDRISHTKWNETEPISIYLTADSNVNSCFSEPVRLLLFFFSLSLFYLFPTSAPLYLPLLLFGSSRRFEFQYIEKCLNHPTFAIYIGYFCLCVNWMVWYGMYELFLPAALCMLFWYWCPVFFSSLSSVCSVIFFPFPIFATYNV